MIARSLARRDHTGELSEILKRAPQPALRKRLPDDVAVNVGQAEVPSLELVGQPRVVDAEAVQDRRVEVVDVHRVVDDVVGVVVGLPMLMPGLMPPPAIHIVKQRG